MNVGNIDRLIRVLLGMGGLIAGIMTQQVAFYALAVIMIISGVLAYCPLYMLFGFHTGKSKKNMAIHHSTDQTV